MVHLQGLTAIHPKSDLKPNLFRYNYVLDEIKSENNSVTEKIEWIKKGFETYMKEYFYEAKVRPKLIFPNRVWPNPMQTQIFTKLNPILDYNRCTRMRWQESKTITISRNNV